MAVWSHVSHSQSVFSNTATKYRELFFSDGADVLLATVGRFRLTCVQTRKTVERFHICSSARARALYVGADLCVPVSGCHVSQSSVAQLKSRELFFSGADEQQTSPRERNSDK